MAGKTVKLRAWTKEDVRTLKTLAREKTKTTVIARKLRRSVYLPNLLLNKELLLAISYSIFEATRQLSPGGCFPLKRKRLALFRSLRSHYSHRRVSSAFFPYDGVHNGNGRAM
jgi:hypothetical protein